MPTIDQAIEYLKQKRLKYGGTAHTNHIVVSEEARQNAIENKPDEAGRQHTRVSLETYSPSAYSLWNQIIEQLMEKLGYNPILLVDVLALLVRAAGDEGVEKAKDELAKALDYEQELRDAKAERKKRSKS